MFDQAPGAGEKPGRGRRKGQPRRGDGEAEPLPFPAHHGSRDLAPRQAGAGGGE